MDDDDNASTGSGGDDASNNAGRSNCDNSALSRGRRGGRRGPR